ncbi:MAG: M15 family metallopeptidase, partial [Gemmatimonadaceae bacterium]
MSMLPINVGSSEPKIESASSSRPKREADSPNAASTNAFAATLAHAMHTPDKPAPAPKPRDANSDLDSRVSGKVSAPGTGANDGKPAFAAAAEARAAVAATPVDSASSDADALNPDFRTRLARVVSRMHEEFGKDVQLVEGFRTQSRQDFLYDQGRTRPGGVVTWTKSSKHTLGLAADVMIDGSYTDAAGFQQLAQVAAQEGLRTLGAKDPGHIELPTRGGAAAWGSSADAVNIDDNVSRAIGIALDPGNSDGRSGDSNTFGNFNGFLSRAGRGSATSAPPIQMPMMSGGGGMGSGSMSQRGFNDSQKDSTRVDDSAKVANVATVASIASVAQVAQVAHAAGLGQPQPSTLAAPVMVPTMSGTGSDAADKVGRILDARDAAPVQPLSQVTLNIDNPAGGAADQVTIQLRSGAVDTAISIGDPNRADRMSLRVGELQHALEQHGLNATAINVASTASGSGPGWNPRPGSDQSAQNGRASLNYRDNRQDADGTR